MWLTVMKTAGSIWSGLSSFIGDGFRWLVAFGAYRLGRRKERQIIIERRLEQDNEAADTKRRVATDDDLRRELRDKYLR
jgi:hypothetical protein